MEIKKIRGVVKDYAWGNKDYIPSLTGKYTGFPQAELWLGTHPAGCAAAEDGKTLAELIREDRSLLGEDWERRGGLLPFMMKILAVDSPLSIQCHPDKAQAEAGWKREADARSKGLPVSYQDDNGKRELFMALSPAAALCGFRDIEEIKADLAAVIPGAFGRTVRSLSGSIRELFMGLFALPASEKAIILSEYRDSLSSSSEPRMEGLFLSRCGVALRCLEKYPDDISCLFPYLMNLVHLQIGEALDIVPGTLHAYVFGCGVEVMDASDNVLRAGLTGKRIDLEELERIASFNAGKPLRCVPSPDGYGRSVYASSSDNYKLISVPSGRYEISGDKLGIAMVTEGSARFSSHGESLTLEKGEAAVIPASLHYTLSSRGQLYISEVF